MATFLDFLQRGGPSQQWWEGGTPWPLPFPDSRTEGRAGMNPYTEIQPLGTDPGVRQSGAEFRFTGPPGSIPAPTGTSTGMGLFTAPIPQPFQPTAPPNAEWFMHAPLMGGVWDFYRQWLQQVTGQPSDDERLRNQQGDLPRF